MMQNINKEYAVDSLVSIRQMLASKLADFDKRLSLNRTSISSKMCPANPCQLKNA